MERLLLRLRSLSLPAGLVTRSNIGRRNSLSPGVGSRVGTEMDSSAVDGLKRRSRAAWGNRLDILLSVSDLSPNRPG